MLFALVVSFVLAFLVAWFTMPSFRMVVKSAPRRFVHYTGALVAGVVVLGSSAPSFAQSLSLNFDLQPFFDNMNVYLPVFIGVFGIVGGIAAALVLSRFVINAVINAFKGGSV
jgi:phage shock protein PspC (stress-responsive transcriptional regulator)